MRVAGVEGPGVPIPAPPPPSAAAAMAAAADTDAPAPAPAPTGVPTTDGGPLPPGHVGDCARDESPRPSPDPAPESFSGDGGRAGTRMSANLPPGTTLYGSVLSVASATSLKNGWSSNRDSADGRRVAEYVKQSSMNRRSVSSSTSASSGGLTFCTTGRHDSLR